MNKTVRPPIVLIVHFPRFGPYHVARINAAFEELKAAGVKVVGMETAVLMIRTRGSRKKVLQPLNDVWPCREGVRTIIASKNVVRGKSGLGKRQPGCHGDPWLQYL